MYRQLAYYRAHSLGCVPCSARKNKVISCTRFQPPPLLLLLQLPGLDPLPCVLNTAVTGSSSVNAPCTTFQERVSSYPSDLASACRLSVLSYSWFFYSRLSPFFSPLSFFLSILYHLIFLLFSRIPRYIYIHCKNPVEMGVADTKRSVRAAPSRTGSTSSTLLNLFAR